MSGADAYFKYRQSLEDIQYLARTIPYFLRVQEKMVCDLKNKHEGGPAHPLYKERKLFDVYKDKDYEALMGKQLLFSLFARFELFINELLKLFLLKNYNQLKKVVDKVENEIDLINIMQKSCNIDELYLIIVNKYLSVISRKIIKEQLNLLYKLIPLDFQKEIDISVFEEIDYYYVVRNLFIHNDGIINNNAVKRASKYLFDEDISKKIRFDIVEFDKVFELLSSTSCKISSILDKF